MQESSNPTSPHAMEDVEEVPSQETLEHSSEPETTMEVDVTPTSEEKTSSPEDTKDVPGVIDQDVDMTPTPTPPSRAGPSNEGTITSRDITPTELIMLRREAQDVGGTVGTHT